MARIEDVEQRVYDTDTILELMIEAEIRNLSADEIFGSKENTIEIIKKMALKVKYWHDDEI